MASEAHLRAQYEVRDAAIRPLWGSSGHRHSGDPLLFSRSQALAKENRLLKHSVEKLERENHDLKRSVYELTLKCVLGIRREPF